MTSKRLIGIAKAAELLGVGISTLRAWDDSGALKAERTKGGHRRYRIEDIEQLQGIISEDAPPNDCAAIYVIEGVMTAPGEGSITPEFVINVVKTQIDLDLG